MLAAQTNNESVFKLRDGSKVAIIGGGPAGSFFAFFFLSLAHRLGIQAGVDLFEPKDYSVCGPKGCNNCGGIVSESLIQSLAAEGIKIPENVIQNAIETYTMHLDSGSVRISSPSDERRIISMFRGAGPRGSTFSGPVSFDAYLQSMVSGLGARVIHDRVQRIEMDEHQYPVIYTAGGDTQHYDLVVGAAGMTSRFLKLMEHLKFGYRPPVMTKAHISEYYLSEPVVRECFGDVMHVFLLNVPRLRFGAIIPKGDYVSVVLLGKSIDKYLVREFLDHPRVRSLFPPAVNLSEQPNCLCYPMLNVGAAEHPYADRIVMIGDSAATKLYKNGIGAAYLTAKAAATTALMHGVSADDFRRYYLPSCRRIERDNAIGKKIFSVVGWVQGKSAFEKMLIKGVRGENLGYWKKRMISQVLWDVFTGSASYGSILSRMLRPAFYRPLIEMTVRKLGTWKKGPEKLMDPMENNQQVGRLYRDGEVIIRQGEEGDTMHVVMSGKVHVFSEVNNQEFFLAELGESEFFGEMAIFRRMTRSTTVRAAGPAVILTIDKKTLMQNIQDNPSLAFRILEKMSERLENANDLVSQLTRSVPDERHTDGVDPSPDLSRGTEIP